jgi:hypothetical protein
VNIPAPSIVHVAQSHQTANKAPVASSRFAFNPQEHSNLHLNQPNFGRFEPTKQQLHNNNNPTKLPTMSSNNNYTSTSSSSFSFSSTINSSSSRTTDGQTTSHHSTHQTTSDPVNGTTVRTSIQENGQPAVEQTKHYDSQGRELLEGPGGAGGSRQIEDVSGTQAQRDAEYEERMEEEYAKREGGA